MRNGNAAPRLSEVSGRGGASCGAKSCSGDLAFRPQAVRASETVTCYLGGSEPGDYLFRFDPCGHHIAAEGMFTNSVVQCAALTARNFGAGKRLCEAESSFWIHSANV